jgi:hypothetical protein
MFFSQGISPQVRDGCRAFLLRFNVRLYDEVSGGANLVLAEVLA